MSAADLACVILASGLSERFGAEDKLQASLAGLTMLSHVLQTARACQFGEVFVVTQRTAPEDMMALQNDAPELGQGHALRLGARAVLAGDGSHAVILLGDMPLVSVAHILNLISKIDGERSVVSLYDNIRMPPAVFPRQALEFIAAQSSPLGAQVLFDRLNPMTVPLAAEAALDVDTPADLARVSAIMESRST